MFRNHFQLLPFLKCRETEVFFSHQHHSLTNYTSQVRTYSYSVHVYLYTHSYYALFSTLLFVSTNIRFFFLITVFAMLRFYFISFCLLFRRIVKYKCEVCVCVRVCVCDIYAIYLVSPPPLSPPLLSPHSKFKWLLLYLHRTHTHLY